MAGKCKSCAHLRRNEIDRDLVAGVALRNIAAEFGISHVALSRHFKNGHITKQMQEQFRAEGLIEREEITVQIKDLQRLLHAFLRKANDNDDVREVLMLSKEIRGLIELLGKLLGRFPKEPEINILVNPVWLSLKTQIFQALTAYPEARQAVLTAVGEGDLTVIQKQMIVGEPDYKAMSPGVKAIIDKEFGSDPEEQDLERLPEIAYAKEKAKKQKVWKVKPATPASVSRLRLLCVKEHSFNGKCWSPGQIWDSEKPDGPEPGGGNWTIFNPAIHSGLEPTTRR